MKPSSEWNLAIVKLDVWRCCIWQVLNSIYQLIYPCFRLVCASRGGASTTAVNRILRALQHHKGTVTLLADFAKTCWKCGTRRLVSTAVQSFWMVPWCWNRSACTHEDYFFQVLSSCLHVHCLLRIARQRFVASSRAMGLGSPGGTLGGPRPRWYAGAEGVSQRSGEKVRDVVRVLKDFISSFFQFSSANFEF